MLQINKNKKGTIEKNFNSNSFIKSGVDSPVNDNGSVSFYTSIYMNNQDYICRHTLNYSTLISQLQIDILELANKWHNIIVELDRIPFKNKIVKEIVHKSEKYKYYIVPYVGAIPGNPIICDDLVTMLNTLKELIEITVRRYDYIIIANCFYNGDTYNENGIIVM